MAELVGGAFLSAFFQSLFHRINSGEIVDFFRGGKQVRLHERLKMMLLSVEVVLDDAEMKQMRNPGIKHWLEGLKDSAEDAENLLNEISTDALEAKILCDESVSASSSSTVARGFYSRVFCSRGHDRNSKMEEILERLEYFASQKDILGLNTGIGGRVSWRLPSTSLVEYSEVYGREEDQNVLKKLVLSKSAETMCVIPIVGMGGVGKTTLAQALFNDGEVNDEFEVKVWVCVSEEFDVCRVTKIVLEAVMMNTCDIVDLNMLQVKLKATLQGKKFFLVLDDVWNENYDDWDVLRRPFQDGAKGSKIIVTTRSEKVASVMGSSTPHHLNGLLFGDCWELFAKHASGSKDFMHNAELEAIGKEIVMKCKGLPLAAKTLGGLLRSTLDAREWVRVLKSDIWDFTDDESNILPALRVSYHYLPSNLKRCFAHCSMFPKDYEFQKEELVSLWMAENFLGHSQGNKRMEDVGDEYFNDLLSRSFFQRVSNVYKSWFVIHDLMVDLAKFVSGNSFHLGDVESSSVNVTKVRHLTHYVKDYDSRTWFNFDILEATRLRTFFQLRHGNIPDKVVQYLPLKFKFLRSLSLHSINTLPDSIKELKHLCYLDLSNSLISKLPESVCELYNLQTLNLSECRYLKTLPRYMHRLINLRCLRISEECVEMPTQMRKLTNLQSLNIFIVGKEVGRGICELKDLSNLRGSLCIKNIRYAVNAKDASGAKLVETKDLKDLLLDWGNEDTDNTMHENVVLGNLAPSTIIECLEINHYGGTRFPNWVGDRSYYNIVKMELLNCENCISLPPLGQLACLTILTVDGFPAIEIVDHGFYGNSASLSMNSFPSLKRLELSRMPNWNDWLTMQLGDAVAFPKLEILHIRDCPKLVKKFPNSFPSLTRLSINKCQSINCSLPTMPVLQSLDLEDCHSLATLGNLPATLKRLTIRGCEELEFPFPTPHGSLNHLTIVNSCNSIQCFPLNYFTSLTRLSMRRLNNLESVSMLDEAVQEMESLSLLAILSCPNFVSFPAGGFSAPKLSYLTISSCNKLKCWPEQMHTLFPSLVHMRIARCPEVDSFPAAGFPSNLRAITVAYCDKLVASRSWNLTRLMKLEVFEIVCSSDIMCFPEEGLLPISITSLTINSLSSMEMLNRNGLLQLTSLKQLEISFCPNLRTITVEELPNSLEILNIYECPLLDYDELKKRVRECLKDIYIQVTP